MQIDIHVQIKGSPATQFLYVFNLPNCLCIPSIFKFEPNPRYPSYSSKQLWKKEKEWENMLRAWGEGGRTPRRSEPKSTQRALEVGKWGEREKGACAWCCMHSYCSRRPPPTVAGAPAQQVHKPVDCYTGALAMPASGEARAQMRGVQHGLEFWTSFVVFFCSTGYLW